MHTAHLQLATALALTVDAAVEANDPQWLQEVVVVGLLAWGPVYRDLLLLAIAAECEAARSGDAEVTAPCLPLISVPSDPHSGGVKTVIGLARSESLGVVRVAN